MCGVGVYGCAVSVSVSVLSRCDVTGRVAGWMGTWEGGYFWEEYN